MIDIRSNTTIDINDVIRRSPVAGVQDAEAVLRECMLSSVDVRYGMLDGKVACMWGLIPPTILSDVAYLWLLTTDIVAEHKFLFIRHSQVYIEDALKQYPTIIGDVFIENTAAKRWLKWLGAEFKEPIGQRVPFVIKAKVLNG